MIATLSLLLFLSDYKIPVRGNLKDPHFRLSDVLLDLLKNIFIKPATTPYRMVVRNVEKKIETAILLNWEIRQSSLRNKQEKMLTRIAEFLKKYPLAKISVYPFEYEDREKEYILLYDAKRKYYFATKNRAAKSMTRDDSITIERMSSKDSLFMGYLDKQFNDTMLFTVQEKCLKYIGTELVNAKFNLLIKERERVFMNYFKSNQTEKQIKLMKSSNTHPFNGYSFYKISYDGQVPEELLKAYAKLEELNNEPTRNKYESYRKAEK